MFLTITEIFVDEHGTVRYDNVSWPIFRIVDDITYAVLDFDGEFEVDCRKCVISNIPSRLINISFSDYQVLLRTKDITDYNAFYKILGVHQENNVRGQYSSGEFDVENKKTIINEVDYGKSEKNALLKRNLSLTAKSV